MSNFTATFDGHDLGELFVVSQPERTLTAWEPTLLDGAAVGALYAGTKPQAMEVALTLTTFAATREERLAALRTLSGWLAVSEPKSLALADELQTVGSTTYQLTRLAVPTGQPRVTQAIDAMAVEVTFICPDPTCSGTGWSNVMHSGERQLTFDVIGTAPTLPVILIHDALGDAFGRFQLDFVADGATQSIKFDDLPQNEAAIDVVINCASRTYAVNSVPAMLKLPNDWLELQGGSSVTVSLVRGSFSLVSVLYADRWW